MPIGIEAKYRGLVLEDVRYRNKISPIMNVFFLKSIAYARIENSWALCVIAINWGEIC